MLETLEKYWTWFAIGGLVLLFVLYYLFSKGSSGSSAGQNFSFSVGPTDAQIAAGTSQQNQVQADNTAIALANINATTSTANATTYAQYLTTNSANGLAATQATLNASVATNAANDAVTSQSLANENQANNNSYFNTSQANQNTTANEYYDYIESLNSTAITNGTSSS